MKQTNSMTFPIGAEVDGVEITFDKKRKVLIIGGFYDRVCPIEDTEITLWEFLERLDIEKADISYSRKKGKI